MINSELRESVFSLVGKFQELHLEVCKALIDPDDKEVREKVVMMLREVKILVGQI